MKKLFICLMVTLLISFSVHAQSDDTVILEEIELEEVLIDETIEEQEYIIEDLGETSLISEEEPVVQEEESAIKETEPSSLIVTKRVVGDMWHIRCDIMDTTAFEAGGGKWKTDVIKNPSGNLSKEGHRSNKCGDDSHWVIWVDTAGQPYRMDEIKSGATGGTLPTVIYKPRYDLSTSDIQNMMPDDYDLVYKYSQNFIDVMPFSEIKIGERLYWTTQNGGQVWYHSGIPYKSAPNFILYIDGIGYPLVAGESVELSDLEPGIHEITEEPNAQYYLGEVSSNGAALNSNGEWSATIEIGENEEVIVEWPNVVITPEPKNTPKPPAPPVVVTPTPTIEITESPTVEVTETPTASLTVEVTESPTPKVTEPPVLEETETPTPAPTNTPELTATPTPKPTDTPVPTPTAMITNEPTVVPTTEPTVESTEEPTVEPTAEPTNVPTEEPTMEPTNEPTEEPASEPSIGPTTKPSEEPTAEPTEVPTIEPTAVPTIEVKTEEPIVEPTIKVTEEPTSVPTEEPTEEPTSEPTSRPTPMGSPAVVVATSTPVIDRPSDTPTPVTKQPDPTRTSTPIPTTATSERPIVPKTVEPTTKPTITPVKTTVEPTISAQPTEKITVEPQKTPELITVEPTIKTEVLELTEEPTIVPTPTPRPTLSLERIEEIMEQVRELPEIKVGGPRPHFENLTEEELEELLDLFDYQVPLYGDLLQTGDEVPPYVYVSMFFAVIFLVVSMYIKKFNI